MGHETFHFLLFPEFAMWTSQFEASSTIDVDVPASWSLQPSTNGAVLPTFPSVIASTFSTSAIVVEVRVLYYYAAMASSPANSPLIWPSAIR